MSVNACYRHLTSGLTANGPGVIVAPSNSTVLPPNQPVGFFVGIVNGVGKYLARFDNAALDVTVRRNGYGRQIASFETPVTVRGGHQVPGVFIRAPRIVDLASSVEVWATHDHGDGDHPVLVRQGAAWGCSFHPELTSDTTVHGLFVQALGEALR